MIRVKHLSLEKKDKKAKIDSVIFQSLTEPLLDGQIILDQGWPTTGDMLLYITMGIAGLCLVALTFTIVKLRKVIITLNILQSTMGRAHAASAPKFHYKQIPVPTSQSDINPFENIQLSWDQGIFLVASSI